MAITICCVILLIGLFLNVPVFVSVTAACLSYVFLSPDALPVFLPQRFVAAGENITLLAIPCFILLGNLLNYSGITTRLLTFAQVITGRMIGGLAQTNVLLSTMMGGLSASNLADCAMLTKMMVPEMEKQGYDRSFAAAVTASGALITPIIPPGIALIIYGYVADVSIGDMFLAGIVPGITCCLALMLAIRLVAARRGYRPSRTAPVTGTEFWAAAKGALPALVLVLVIIGGIRVGIVTPTEAGAVGVIYVVIVGAFVFKEMSWDNFKSALWETAKGTGGIMLIIMACSVLAWAFTWEMVAQDVAAFMTGFTDNKYLFLILLNVVFLFVGMFMEGTAATIVLVPLLLPTVKAFGIDPVQFGLIIILNLSIGCLTPPMGTVMFIACSVSGTKTKDFVVSSLPLLAALVAVLALVTFVPAFSTLLPALTK